MPQVEVKNTFHDGLDKDTVQKYLKSTAYRDALDITLSDAGNYFVPSNLNGTDSIQEITDGADFTGSGRAVTDKQHVLGAFHNTWAIDGTDVDAIVVFTIEEATAGDTYNIYVYDVDNDTLYTIYTRSGVTAAEIAGAKSVDVVVYQDADVEEMYFTDKYNDLGRLKCTLTTGGGANYPFTTAEITLQRVDSKGSIAVAKATNTSSRLLCGKYWITYRLIDTTLNRYTRWAPMSRALSIFDTQNFSSTDVYVGGVGQVSAFGESIETTFTLSAADYDEFSHYQIGVMEAVDGSNLQPTVLKLKSIKTIASLVSASYVEEIIDNAYTGFIAVSEYATEDAALDKVGTLATQDNRLVLGDITYKDFSFDNGTPAARANEKTFATDGSDTADVNSTTDIISIASHGYTTGEEVTYIGSNLTGLTSGNNYFLRAVTAGTLSVHPTKADADADTSKIDITDAGLFSHRFYQSYMLRTVHASDVFIHKEDDEPGHFGGEVYRYYLAYYDGKGNFAPPVVLDLNGCYENDISGTIKDFKYPARNSHANSLFDDSGTRKIEKWGLQLKDIHNHPTWAKGFRIFRAERYKDLLYQTPLIPASFIKNAQAVGDYPQDSLANAIDDTVQPADPTGTLVPKNFFRVLNSDITRAEATSGTYLDGEVQHVARNNTSENTWFVFPPSYMYDYAGVPSSDDPYTFKKGHLLDIVNVAFLKSEFKTFSSPPNSEVVGDYHETLVDGTFFAVDPDDYWFYRGDSIADPETLLPGAYSAADAAPIKEYVEITQGSTEGAITKAATICNYDSLTPTNLTEGVPPTGQKMAAITLGRYRANDSARVIDEDPAYYSFDDTAPWTAVADDFCAEIVTGSRSGFIGILSAERALDTENDFFSGAASDETIYRGAVWIGNVKRGLNDDRYGDDSAVWQMVDTGAGHHFTDAELVDVAASTELLIDLEVWGGDCYISPHTFKLSNSVYSVSGANKAGSPLTSSTTTQAQWGNAYADSGGTNEVARAVPLAGVSQLVTVILESEVNGHWLERGNYDDLVSTSIEAPYNSTDEGVVRQGFDYAYNNGYSIENKVKTLIPYDSTKTVITEYPSRLAYSDVKIQGSIEEGFDRIRAGNTFDINGEFGSITKLVRALDNLYAIQENGISYIPTGNKIIEGTEESVLQIRSGEFINDPRYISTQYGTKFPRTVQVGHDKVFFVDGDRRSVVSFDREGFRVLSEKGMITEFNTKLSALSDNDRESLHAGYDPIKRMYILSNEDNGQDWCYVWSDLHQCWVSKWSYNNDENATKAWLYIGGQGYIVGSSTDDGNDLDILTVETNAAVGSFYTTIIDSFITFIVNDEKAYETVKTFDNQILDFFSGAGTGGNLGLAQYNTYRNTGLGDQAGSATVNLNVTPRQDIHKFYIPRAVGGERLRGTYLQTKLFWDNSAVTSSVELGSVITKYRVSRRRD